MADGDAKHKRGSRSSSNGDDEDKTITPNESTSNHPDNTAASGPDYELDNPSASIDENSTREPKRAKLNASICYLKIKIRKGGL